MWLWALNELLPLTGIPFLLPPLCTFSDCRVWGPQPFHCKCPPLSQKHLSLSPGVWTQSKQVGEPRVDRWPLRLPSWRQRPLEAEGQSHLSQFVTVVTRPPGGSRDPLPVVEPYEGPPNSRVYTGCLLWCVGHCGRGEGMTS